MLSFSGFINFYIRALVSEVCTEHSANGVNQYVFQVGVTEMVLKLKCMPQFCLINISMIHKS